MTEKLIPLRDLNKGEKATITSILVGGDTGRRIRDMGLIPGADIEILGRAPLKDPVAVKLKGFTLSLRNHEADEIMVEVQKK